MTVGLEVYNLDGILIIDATTPNYGFVRKVLMSSLPKMVAPNSPFSTQVPYLDIPSGIAPLLFYASVGLGTVGVITIQVTSSLFRYFFDTSANTALSRDVEIFIFDLMHAIYPAGSESGVGFETYDATGRLIFTTAMKPLRPILTSVVSDGSYSTGESVAYSAGNGTNGHNTGGAYSDTWVLDNLPTGVKFAAGITRFRYGSSSSSTEITYGEALIEHLYVSPNLVRLEPIGTNLANEDFGGFIGTELDYVTGRPPTITLIDVTNY